MWTNPQFPSALFTFTKEILNGKFHFLCSVLCGESEYDLLSHTAIDRNQIFSNMAIGRIFSRIHAFQVHFICGNSFYLLFYLEKNHSTTYSWMWKEKRTVCLSLFICSSIFIMIFLVMHTWQNRSYKMFTTGCDKKLMRSL